MKQQILSIENVGKTNIFFPVKVFTHMAPGMTKRSVQCRGSGKIYEASS